MITGDKVQLSGSTVTGVRPAKGREKIPMFRQVERKHHYVIPADAAGLVTAGKLDRELFDVDALVSYRYDDAHSATLPVIVQHDQKVQPKLVGAQLRRNVPEIGVTAVREQKSAATAFWNSAKSAGKIWLDSKLKLNDVSDNLNQIGAPTAWKAGYSGTGVTVAVLDGGIDATHPDFAGKITAQQNFTDAASADDTFGHGTHVASIAAGSGAASGGKYSGVAPGAKIAVGKVCDGDSCDTSAILAGMVWAARTVKAKVVNLSLGGPASGRGDPLVSTLNQLSSQNGTLFVVAAGNDGFAGSVNSPGSADQALTVGAVDGKDQLAPFSSQGPRQLDEALKPDIVAPGVGIVAAKAKNGVIGNPSDNPAYVALDGTSMATPHVAGAAAVLAGEHPDWTGQQLKAALMASAKTLPKVSVFAQGAGRLDIGRAVGQQLVANPPSVSVPTQVWPHNDDKPAAQSVSYHNYGKTPLTLALSTDVRGPDGKSAPAAMFAVTPKTLTVPAGADAAATFTTNTAVAGKDGEYTGGIIANTTDGQSVRTPIAVNREVESYNLTIKTIGRDGGPPPADYLLGFVAYGEDVTRFPSDGDQDGTASVRLPKGQYAAEVLTFESDSSSVDLIAPYLTVNHDLTVVMDTRKAKPADVTVDQAGAQSMSIGTNGTFYTSSGSVAGTGLGAEDPAHLLTGTIGAAAPAALYSQVVTSDWADPGPAGDFVDSAYAYHLAQLTAGRMPTGVLLHAKKAGLSRVRQKVLPTMFSGQALRAAVFSLPDGVVPFQFPTGAASTKPGVQTEYLSPGAQRWTLLAQLNTPDGQPVASFLREPGPVVAGDFTDVANAPALGPGFFADGPDAPLRSGQLADDLVSQPPMFSGGDQRYRGILFTGGASAVLYKDGVKVADGPGYIDYHAPSADASYRMVVTQSQSLGALSTSVSGELTFRSKKVTGSNGYTLPLLAPRFAPKTDDHGTAPAGAGFSIPIVVDQQVTANSVTGVTVEFSTDDGKTWQSAAVNANGPKAWAATVANPGSGFVSLRATATDSAGNTGKVTIIRAYAIS
ncbi:S8 family serine peptidase [Fodinicola feengrottensis]|uniref:S8 family serine peptidase n=1 Tax=Fodinicola feengrottensis TaxID=435914 RepID=A0ABN2IT33_9ACTN